MRSRRTLLLVMLLGVVGVAWLGWRNFASRQRPAEEPGINIEKQAVVFVNHSFDPNAPPAEMPALAYGEEAICDSNFIANTRVGGVSEKTDATHATVTIRKVNMTLQLHINIWVPKNASPHVVEHEDGHRQISEDYYRNAEQLAQRVATSYTGRQVAISGVDLNAEMEKVLQQTASDVTNDYDKAQNVAATQQYYDRITDHGRNELEAKQAVAAALENTEDDGLKPADADSDKSSRSLLRYQKAAGVAQDGYRTTRLYLADMIQYGALTRHSCLTYNIWVQRCIQLSCTAEVRACRKMLPAIPGVKQKHGFVLDGRD